VRVFGGTIKMKIPKSLELFRGKIKGIRHSHHDCYRAICLCCGSDELRIFELGLEVRCGSCSFGAFGVEQFTQKLKELRRSPDEEGVANCDTLDEPEGRRGEGICVVCGEPFEIPSYMRRVKQYCSPKFRQRASMQR
jgi:hypothetical protein